MTPSAIVFDFDGTIADTEWPVFMMMRTAFRSHGLDIALAEWVDTIGRADNGTLEDVLRNALGRDPDPEVIEQARDHHHTTRNTTPVLPGVVELIGAARAAGLPLAIASSSPSHWVQAHLERLEILHHFDAVRTRDHVDHGKPAPDLFLAASAALDVNPATVVAIEDSRHGCASAKAAGMTCVVVPNRITRLDVAPDADLVLDSLTDFPYERFGL